MAHRHKHHSAATTGEGFARLLRRLSDDPDQAALEYHRLRRTLVKFFDWRGAWAPDECADEALDRLAGKLEVGTPIDDVVRYVHGIARLVLLERLRQQAHDPIEPLDDRFDLSSPRAVSPDEADSALRPCFERCLERLTDESRTLVLEYYVGSGQSKIDRRKQLARSLGLSDNALRSRVQRLRDRLEQCVQSCVAAADTEGLAVALRHVSTARNTVEAKPSDGD
jgi:DNA-directed RNA polymerase specialized sigma24 family protein